MNNNNYHSEYQQQQHQAAYNYNIPQASYPPTQMQESHLSPPTPNFNRYSADSTTKLTNEEYPKSLQMMTEAPDQLESNIFTGKSVEASAAANSKTKPPIGKFVDRICCCFPRSIAARIVCFVVCLIICVAIIVIGVLFFPRFPNIKVLALNTKNVQAFQFIPSTDPSLVKNLNYMTIKLKLNMTVSVFNPNYYDLAVDTLALTANLNVNQTSLKEHGIHPALLSVEQYIGPAPVDAPASYQPNYNPTIGQANTTHLLFPARTNVTFSMDFDFTYTPDSMIGLVKDPAFAEGVDACGQQNSPGRPSQISYNAVSTISSLEKIGYKPTVSGSVYISCPFSKDQFSAVEAALKQNPNQDPIEVLTIVLNSPNGVTISPNGTITPGV